MSSKDPKSPPPDSREEENTQKETQDVEANKADAESSTSASDPHVDDKKEEQQQDDTSKESTADSSDDRSEAAKDKKQDKTEQAPAESWAAAWNEQYQTYYWWNTVTQETTWENPYETGRAVAPLPPSEGESPAPQEAATSDIAQQQTYAYQAYFNTRTGKFQAASDVDRLNPERMSIENRAKRQMQYYFDVDAYTEQRNQERMAAQAGQKRPLTKRDIERFKKAKHEKKMKRAREWLCD
ncbi:hypothetical protein BCR43DRAFT_492793 [Syncephalastrum racemosum]|uniref:WW domain-containing protein n=1 Tax=Syncephalastrum racemosum TaxID=13706 RepID=A0A1X2H9I3_SYNRA|nr:hypothetical protein BCR43DRAFT_492793 [Syncephalastrum racemosum]